LSVRNINMGNIGQQNIGYIDLHVHSTYSDGMMTPNALLTNAAEHGLVAISITDHDSVEGILKCFEQPINSTVYIIPGIELTARNNRELHILGLFIDPLNNELNVYTQQIKALKMKLYIRAFAILRSKGIILNLQELRQKDPQHSLTTLRDFVLNCYTSITIEDFDTWMESLYYTWQNEIATSGKCIEIIHRANGVAVLAHPGKISVAESKVYNVIKTLARQGLDGIECFHPCHTEIQIEKYMKIADDFGLCITGGSDFHGYTNSEIIGYYLADKRIPASIISEITKHLERNNTCVKDVPFF